MTDVQIGFLGIGLLGGALAARLVRAGFSLCGFDPDAAAAARLRDLGGLVAASPAEVARRGGRMIWSLPGPEQVRAAVEELEPALQPGAIILDTTTGDPADVEAHAARLARRGVAYLDCEIGGSSRQAVAGEALILCGGERRAFEECREILNALSGCVFHTGPAGTGTRMKLALNIAIGLHRAVLAETLGFAEANGIDAARALTILKAGPAYSAAMDVKGSKMLARDFAPEARLAQHLKDVRLILKTGRATGARLPFSTLHETLLKEAVELGLGGFDNSAVVELFRKPQDA